MEGRGLITWIVEPLFDSFEILQVRWEQPGSSWFSQQSSLRVELADTEP